MLAANTSLARRKRGGRGSAAARREYDRRVCRILAYIGEPLSVQSLLFDTDNSLVRQSYSPRMMNTFLNLAGFGMKAWDPRSLRPDDPFTYRATTLPSFDRNLRSISSKLAPTCLVAHVRGVTYSGEAVVADTNLHPFHFAGARVVLAHNGHLRQFARMRYSLLEHVRPELARASRERPTRSGSTRWSCLSSTIPTGSRMSASSPMRPPAPSASCARVRAAHGIDTSSPVNLCVSTGQALVATRISFDYGWYPPEDEMLETDLPFVSLWYAIGGEYTESDGGWHMTAGTGPFADHRVRAAHDRLLDLARGAGILDADRRAHARRRRVRDAGPGCLTARRSITSPRFRSSRTEEAQTWSRSRA